MSRSSPRGRAFQAEGTTYEKSPTCAKGQRYVKELRLVRDLWLEPSEQGEQGRELRLVRQEVEDGGMTVREDLECLIHMAMARGIQRKGFSRGAV